MRRVDLPLFSFPFSFLPSVPDVEYKWHEPMSGHTTFRIGGPVFCLAGPQTEKAFAELMHQVRSEGIPYAIVGGGSNMLAPDDLWEVLAIQLHVACADIRPCEEFGEGVSIFVGAGVRLSRWLGFCLHNGLSGMEFLTGIPGTIGGALVMNAGTARGCMVDSLIWMECLDEKGKRQRVYKSELAAEYRSMKLPGEWVVLGACFRMRAVSDRSMRVRLHELMKERKRTQPLGQPSAGCIFKNPSNHSAGALIDRAGLKGFRIGDAQVSNKHANWIINEGNAKARDVLALIQTIEQEVFARFGIRLEREIQVLG